jgi:hypothetical protein
VCAAVSIAVFTNLFDEDVVDFDELLLGAALFTLFWLLLGLWLIVAAQAFAKVWMRHEKSCQDLRSLTHVFQEAQIDIVGGAVPRRLQALYKDFQYAIMRQLFICPTFLPPVSETYLRTDFNLAEYLSRAIADVIHNVFAINWMGYAFLIIAVAVWRVLVYAGDDVLFVMLWVMPGVAILFLLALIVHLKGVYNQLVPKPTNEVVLNLPRDNFGRSPEMNEGAIPRPAYLEGQLHPLAQENNFVSCCFVKMHPLKLTWGYIFAGTFPNRQELLFYGDKYGVDIIIGIVQGLAICMTFWITVIIIYYLPWLYDDWDVAGVFMTVGCILIWVFCAGYLLPDIVRLIALTSKIEMKKDRAIIEQVVLQDRAEKAKAILRIYRQFKMVYRGKYGENKKVNDKDIENYATDVFNICKDRENNMVHIEELEDLIALCGLKLENDELRLFAKECKPVDNQFIPLENFKTAVLTIFASRKLKPDFVVRTVLERYYKEGKGRNVKDASLEEIKQFFNDFWWHFVEEDVEDFLWETRFVLEDTGTAEINELAGMVRNNVKDYAR